MKGSLIHINQDTFEVKVVCDPSSGFMPSEHTIAIKKYAELVKQKVDEFLEKEHNPRVKKLLQMAADFNYEHNLRYKELLDAMDIPQLKQEVVLPTDVAKRIEESNKDEATSEAAPEAGPK